MTEMGESESEESESVYGESEEDYSDFEETMPSKARKVRPSCLGATPMATPSLILMQYVNPMPTVSVMGSPMSNLVPCFREPNTGQVYTAMLPQAAVGVPQVVSNLQTISSQSRSLEMWKERRQSKKMFVVDCKAQRAKGLPTKLVKVN
ncbi:unnamed protein product [Calypogeia fissa]